VFICENPYTRESPPAAVRFMCCANNKFENAETRTSARFSRAFQNTNEFIINAMSRVWYEHARSFPFKSALKCGVFYHIAMLGIACLPDQRGRGTKTIIYYIPICHLIFFKNSEDETRALLEDASYSNGKKRICVTPAACAAGGRLGDIYPSSVVLISLANL